VLLGLTRDLFVICITGDIDVTDKASCGLAVINEVVKLYIPLRFLPRYCLYCLASNNFILTAQPTKVNWTNSTTYLRFVIFCMFFFSSMNLLVLGLVAMSFSSYYVIFVYFYITVSLVVI